MQVIKKRGRLVAAVLAALVVLSVVGVVASRSFAASPSVTTAVAQRKTLTVKVSVSGKTEADVKRDVFPPVAGKLESIAVTEGQEVHAGQTLATLDTAQLDAAVDAAESAVAQAESAADAAGNAGPSSADRAAANAQLTAASRAYDRAKSAVASAEDALREATSTARAGAKAKLDGAKSAKEQAYAAYLSAKAGVRKLSAADTGPSQRAAHVAEKNAKRALTRAKSTRADYELVAPIDGVVIFNADAASAKASTGSAVSPAAAPFTVVDLSTLDFVAQLDESDVPRVKNAAAATVELDATPGKEYAARIECVRPNSSQTSNGATVFPATMRIDNADKTLRIGMGGSVEITVDDVKDAVVVPIEALVDDKDGQYVYLVENGKLMKCEVKTGAMSESDVQISKGLKVGDVVAITSGANLKDGMQVQTGDKR